MGADRVLLAAPPTADRCELLWELLEDGLQVTVAGSGTEVLTALERLPIAALVLDARVARPDAASLLSRVRRGDRTRDLRVLWLVASRGEEESIRGFALGADDVAPTDTCPRELRLRLRALLRRSPRRRDRPATADAARPVQVGPLRIDGAAQRAWVRDQELELSPRELQLLVSLARTPGATLRREALLREAWGATREIGTRAVDTYINRLRAKLGDEKQLIETVRGVGYRLRPRDLSSS